MNRIISLIAALLLTGIVPGGAQSLAPVFSARDWLNGAATPGQLAGKVVVVDVFTVDCFNCRNVVGTLRDLYAHRGNELSIVGIHSPETPAEQQRAYVVANLKSQGIVWPVAIDNRFRLWDAFGVNAWPTQLFFDRHGRLRKVIEGDSQDAGVRAEVEALLAER